MRAEGRIVVLVEPIPIAPRVGDGHFNPVVCLSGAETIEECSFQATPGPMPMEEVLRDLAAADPGVFVIDIDRATCPAFPRCDPVVDEMVARMDHHHLTLGFSEHLAGTLEALLVDAGVPGFGS